MSVESNLIGQLFRYLNTREEDGANEDNLSNSGEDSKTGNLTFIGRFSCHEMLQSANMFGGATRCQLGLDPPEPTRFARRPSPPQKILATPLFQDHFNSFGRFFLLLHCGQNQYLTEVLFPVYINSGDTTILV